MTSHAQGAALQQTDGSWSPREIVPDDGELAIFGEVSVSVLAIGEEIAAQASDHVPPRQKPRAYVFEGPESGFDAVEYVSRFFDEGVGSF